MVCEHAVRNDISSPARKVLWIRRKADAVLKRAHVIYTDISQYSGY